MKLIKDYMRDMCTGLYLFVLLVCFVDAFTVRQSHFVTTPICVNQESIDNKCVVCEAIVDTAVLCAAMCNANDSCVGASLSANNECYLHRECNISQTCDMMDFNFTHLVKSGFRSPCLNGGKWHFGIKRCICKDGWITQYCDTRAQMCYDLFIDGYQRTYHRVTLDVHTNGSELIDLYCILTPNKAYTLVLANNGSGNFNRSWDQYVSGFGDTYHNTWLGLHSLYLLNQIGHNSIVIRVDFENFSASKYKRTYNNFVMKDSSEHYSFTLTGTHVNSGPQEALLGCLMPLANTAFSTWDRDNDGDSGSNCAALYGAGWWYPNCNITCNLAGYTSAKSADGLQGIDGATMTSHFRYLEIYAVL